MHSHVPQRYLLIRLIIPESLVASMQQRNNIDGACGRRSARNNSRSVYTARMLCALHAACLHADTQSAYNNCHRHGMLSKIGATSLRLTTLLDMGLSA